MPNLRIFGQEFQNNIVMIQITVLEFVLLQSFVQKQKFQNLDQKCLILVFFGLEFENNIVIFEISTFELV